MQQARAAAEALDATLVDMRFVKPMDAALVLELAATHDQFVTLEDNAIMGGAGSAVNELLMGARLCKPVLNLGLPDRFIEQGTRERSTPCWGSMRGYPRQHRALAAGLTGSSHTNKEGRHMAPFCFSSFLTRVSPCRSSG